MTTPTPLSASFVRGTDQAVIFPVADAAGVPRALDAGAALRCELRLDDTRALIDVLSVAVHNEARTEVLVSWTAAQSADWPVTGGATRLVLDLRIDEAGQKRQTAPIAITVIDGVTDDPV